MKEVYRRKCHWRGQKYFLIDTNLFYIYSYRDNEWERNYWGNCLWDSNGVKE